MIPPNGLTLRFSYLGTDQSVYMEKYPTPSKFFRLGVEDDMTPTTGSRDQEILDWIGNLLEERKRSGYEPGHGYVLRITQKDARRLTSLCLRDELKRI